MTHDTITRLARERAIQRLSPSQANVLTRPILAGARMAREQEQERAKVLEDNLALLSEKVALLQAAYRGEA
jgi:hypothetical protein